jgi:hypothetical protein
MKFYEIEIQTDMQGQESKGIYTYDDRDSAEIVFHQKMASGMTAIKNGTLSKVLNMVVNGMGGTELVEYKSAVEEE